jgi:hypothetical protein
MNEIWKDVPNYEGLYQVSSMGRVKRLSGYTPRYRGERIKPDLVFHPESIYKPSRNRKGYLYFDLLKYDGYKRIRKVSFVHRVVLMSFNPNENYKSLQVNHINGIKDDNRVENLEWVTNRDNQLHANLNGLRAPKKSFDSTCSRAVHQCDSEGNILNTFGSIIDASEKTKIESQNIRKVVKGRRPFAGGYIWKYVDSKFINMEHKTYGNYKFRKSLLANIRDSFKRNGFKLIDNPDDIIGLTWSEFISYIELLFTDGMSWENYGNKGWHIDHITPSSKANNYNEMIKLNHYTNLRPMWEIDNKSKGNKIL